MLSLGYRQVFSSSTATFLISCNERVFLSNVLRCSLGRYVSYFAFDFSVPAIMYFGAWMPWITMVPLVRPVVVIPEALTLENTSTVSYSNLETNTLCKPGVCAGTLITGSVWAFPLISFPAMVIVPEAVWP